MLILSTYFTFVVAMIKKCAKYLTILCILLLSFSEQLVRFSCEHIFYQKIEKTTTSNEVMVGSQQGNSAFLFPSSETDNRENTLFDSDEKFEEDEKNVSASSKKNLGTIHAFFISVYNSYARFFFLKNSQVSYFCENLSHFPHNKLFIVFQVFRI